MTATRLQIRSSGRVVGHHLPWSRPRWPYVMPARSRNAPKYALAPLDAAPILAARSRSRSTPLVWVGPAMPIEARPPSEPGAHHRALAHGQSRLTQAGSGRSTANPRGHRPLSGPRFLSRLNSPRIAHTALFLILLHPLSCPAPLGAPFPRRSAVGDANANNPRAPRVVKVGVVCRRRRAPHRMSGFNVRFSCPTRPVPRGCWPPAPCSSRPGIAATCSGRLARGPP